MNWIQILLIGFLYWWAAINLDYWTKKDGDKYTLSVVLLRYVPTILMTLQYMLIYFQMQQLFVVSRI